MTVDRSMWASAFRNDLPDWNCPSCGRGRFALVPDTLAIKETGPSAALHNEEGWDPDWIEQRFSAFLECTNRQCKEIAVVSGTASVDHYPIDHNEYVTDKVLKVEYVCPAPIPIALSESTPEAMREAIHQASTLIWSNPQAAANHIRQAVENMMDDLGIASTNIAGKRINLHWRIAEFKKEDEESGTFLEAIKWLGNSGSHVGGLSRDDVFDAFNILEHVIEERYGNKRTALIAKVKAIIAAKGPAGDDYD